MIQNICKLFFIVFTLYICGYTLIKNYNKKQYSLDILTKSAYNKLQTNIKKQSLNCGNIKSMYAAKIRLLDHKKGSSNFINVTCTDNVKYLEIEIKLHKCYKEKNKTSNQLNIALITINHNSNEKYHGWIFKNMSSLAAPKIKDYFFYLVECKKE